MSGHTEVEDSSTVMRDDEKAVVNAKGERRHGKEIHGGDCFAMIAQKRRPSFCRLRIPWSSPHPTQHSPLRNIEAKHFQFAMDSGRTPSPVLGNHAEDEFAQFPADAPSSCPNLMPREPRPISLEPCSMPAHNSFRLDENQRLLPATPNPPQHHPKQLVRTGESRLRMPSPQDRKLLPKRHVFQDQIPARAKETNSQYRKKPQQTQHETSFTRGLFIMDAPFNYLIRKQIAILASYRERR
jgi:hypothetical protein